MPSFFLVSGHILCVSLNRVLVKSVISKISAPAMPPPSLHAWGNFIPFQKCFTTERQAQVFQKRVHHLYAKGCQRHPLLDHHQLFLF